MKNIKFRTLQSQLQRPLKSNIKLIQQVRKIIIPADKTSIKYRLTKEEYNKLCKDAITPTYKKATENMNKGINETTKGIVQKSFDNVIDRMNVSVGFHCFITIKD